MTETQACTKCLRLLTLDRFGTRRASKNGLAYTCKGCISARDAAWNLSHAEENRARSAKWRAENPERAAATAAAYHDKNRAKINAKTARWRAENPERNRQAIREWSHANREKAQETRRVYRANNPERFLTYGRTRAERIRRGITDPVPSDVKAQLVAVYGSTCMKPGCENTDITIDHIVPLAMDGVHNVSNLQILCSMCNSQKGDRAIIDFRPELKRSVQL